MAMSHVQPLLLLLASFFFLTTFGDRSVDFEYCNGNSSGYDFRGIDRVEISPRSIGPYNIETVWVTVVGFTGSTLKESNWVIEVSRILESGYEFESVYDLCKLIECPVKRGIHFEFSLPGVKIIPNGNTYALRVFDYDEDSDEDRSNERMIFCVSFDMPPRLQTSVSA